VSTAEHHAAQAAAHDQDKGRTPDDWTPPLSEYAVYMTPSEEHRKLGLAVLGAGWHSIVGNGVRWDARVLNCYGLHVVTRGSGWIEWGGRPRTRLPIKAPAAFWLFPGLVHSYQPDAGGWTIMFTLFEGPAAEAYEGLDFLSRQSPVVPLTDVKSVRDLFRELLTIVRTAGPHHEVAAGVQVHRLITAVRASGPGLRTSRAVRELDEHALEPVALQDHADRLGVSVAQLREEVRLATGSTPKEYILRIRLSRAKDLLAATDQSVQQIARAVGYDDPAYFTRLFTQRVGQSPTGFRRGAVSP
jgi:AraC-like DNA-binding protein